MIITYSAAKDFFGGRLPYYSSGRVGTALPTRMADEYLDIPSVDTTYIHAFMSQSTYILR